jgi:hypothetical protein
MEENENDDTEERYEGDDLEDREDTEIINWADQGYYGFIDPQSQFEYDDDVERLSQREKYPWLWDNVLMRWRHRLIAVWRLIRHWLYSWI